MSFIPTFFARENTELILNLQSIPLFLNEHKFNHTNISNNLISNEKKYSGTDKLLANNGKCILLCIIIYNYWLIIPRQIAFNKHVLKDCLATAASVGRIKSESSRVYSTGI